MKPSFGASVVSKFLELRPKPTEEGAQKRLEKKLKHGVRPKPIPPFVRPKISHRTYGNVYYLNPDSTADATVFYIHGGAFENDFSPFHWLFIKELADKTGALTIVPAYRLLPFGTWKEAFSLIAPLYRSYVREHPEKRIILCGDSAGAGLALSLTQFFRKKEMKMPDELILLSPWVDVSMENPEIPVYEPTDPWLPGHWLKVCGKWWAGDLDLHDYRVSPIYGDLKGIKNVTAFLGTREMLYPDVKRFFELLDDDGTNELIVREGLYHVYPLMPVPEAKEAKEIIISKIKGERCV